MEIGVVEMKEYFNLHTLFLSFIIYAFLGWLIEVAFHFYKGRRFVNRGFLWGPVCPIYGIGSIAMLGFLSPLKDNIFYLFLGGFFVATVLEYITGLILEKTFNARWWDYSESNFNLRGYVCLRFSLIWGLASILLVRFLNHKVEGFIGLIPSHILGLLYNLLLVIFVADLSLTISSLVEFRTILEELSLVKEELGERFRERDRGLLERKETIYMKFRERHIRFLEKYPALTRDRFSGTLKKIRAKIKERAGRPF